MTPTRGKWPPQVTRRGNWRARDVVDWRSTVPLAAALALGLGLLYTIRVTAKPLALLVIAVAIAEALDPLVQILERRVSRRVAVAGVYAALLATIGLVGWLIFPVAVTQTQEVIGHIPSLARRIQALVERWNPTTAVTTAALATRLLTSVGTWLLSVPMRILSWLTYVTLVLFLSAYWLVGAPCLRRFVLSLFPTHRRDAVGALLHDTGQAMGG